MTPHCIKPFPVDIDNVQRHTHIKSEGCRPRRCTDTGVEKPDKNTMSPQIPVSKKRDDNTPAAHNLFEPFCNIPVTCGKKGYPQALPYGDEYIKQLFIFQVLCNGCNRGDMAVRP